VSVATTDAVSVTASDSSTTPVQQVESDGATPIVTYGTDDRPGNITVTVTLEEVRRSTRASVDLGQVALNYTVISTDGFNRAGPAEYEWDGRTTGPTLTYTITLVDPTVVSTSPGEPRAVDPGPWAMTDPTVATPRFGGDVRRPQIEPAGPGYAATTWVFIGEVTQYERTIDGETFVLVVPDAAAPVSEPETILAQLAETAQNLSVSGRSDRIEILALPSDGIRTPWGGIASGPQIIVRAELPVTREASTWVHEYVHTRQTFETTTRTEWLIEGSASYYGGYETLHQRRLTYDSFRDGITQLAFESAVLSDPETWPSQGVPYEKGQRVLAYIDVRIRAATDSERTLADVFYRLNQRDRVTEQVFYDSIAAVANRTVADEVRPFVDEGQLPPDPESPQQFVRAPGNDPDGDGISNRLEARNPTQPFVSDTDGDGLSDGRELFHLGTNATAVDTDGDGRLDGAELSFPRTDPTAADTDGDGLDDAAELENQTDPTSADTDGDGLNDTAELNRGADPRYADTDDDGIDDGTEVDAGLDPTAADTDGDGLPDPQERQRGTDPTATDTDDDGFDDAAERTVGTDPTTSTGTLAYGRAYVETLLGGLGAG
jgi:hypothetical protein